MNASCFNTLPVRSGRAGLAVGVTALLLSAATCPAATLINLDATRLPLGPLATWTNTGSLTGNFTSAGTTTPEVVKVKAGQGVQSSATAHYIGPEVPEVLTGNASRTIEAWVFNATPQGEETVFAWGRRGITAINCSFGHGTDASFGAVGHWGDPDIGWDGHITYNEWSYIAYTYDGPNQTTTVYHNGEVANTEVLAAPLDTAGVTTSGVPLHFRVARQNNADGSVSTTGVGDITIGKIRVHDTALDGTAIMAQFNAEVDQFIEKDSDGDSIPDWWEALYPAFLNPNDPADAARDQDTDGLTNAQEFQHKTAPDKPDTDGDGATDSAEVNRQVGGAAAPTDPTNPDTDGDGLRDGVETGTGTFQSAQDTGTDPLKSDSDGDGYGDWQEVLRGSNPNSASSLPQGIDPLVLLDATSLPLGPLPTWDNTGLLADDFIARDPNAPPEVTSVLGIKGVTFNGSEYYTGPAAPLWITGNGAHTIEAWVYNPAIADEETIFAWGRRGGGDGSNLSFNHGANASYGAVGHWGAPDIGWAGNIVAGRWTHVAYSWDPANLMQTVYKDGQVANSRAEANPFVIWSVATTGAPLPFRVASQNEDSGAATTGLRGSMTIAKVAVYDQTLSEATIQQHFTADATAFGILDQDGDGMPDWYEKLFSFLNPNDPTDATKDQDNDGLVNLQEYEHKTLPDVADTDGDGVTDGAEVNTLSTRPTVTDTDLDGLPDGREGTLGTNPLIGDTDGDGFADGLEIARGSDPKAAANVPSFSQAVAMIDVDARNLALGPLAFWTNNGALGGQFKAGPVSASVAMAGGVKSVTFDGTNYMTGPVAPYWMTGDSPRTVEAWVYNPQLADEETVFSWGRRGGPDGSNCSFNHGTNPSYGAVGHWGGADVGWNGAIAAGRWNHIAYTWDPNATAAVVYSDGQPANTNIYSNGLDTWSVNDTPEPDAVPLTFVLAAQTDSSGAITEALRGSLSVARLRAYDQALGADAIAQIYDSESGQYAETPTITIQSFAYSGQADTFTITWTTAPGAQYEVQATSNLGGAWTSVASGLTTGTYTDHPSAAGTQRFYRIRQQ